ncbi:hypothetical protein BDW72DRAFT_198439 [Aspergillus terricola var. indicus]
MLGLSSKSADAAPAYDELDTIREPNNSNGYFAVPKDDTERAQDPIDDLSLSKRSCGSCSLPPPRTFQPHVHCDICDAFLTRHQRVRTERFYCGTIAATVMFALICGLMLAVVISCTKRRYYDLLVWLGE